ncbi:MAG: hypothetical protein HY430_00030 [Candidatus Levybacteria bacterium]|nr:hypothetical protein [Candidatus Levybacteria bacterium]
MKKRFGVVLGLLGTILLPAQVYAQNFNLCPAPAPDRDYSILCDLRPDNGLPAIMTFAIVIAIIIALFYLIWGGIKWITSGGDKEKVSTARNQIISVVVGLILVFLSWFIINFILQVFFGKGISDGPLTVPQILGTDDRQIRTPFTIFASPTPTPLPNESRQNSNSIIVTPTTIGSEPEPTLEPGVIIVTLTPTPEITKGGTEE